jgi:transmembrane sensor
MTPIDKEALRWALLRAERSLTQAERAAFAAWHDADIRHKGAYLRAQAIHNALSRATVQENLRPTGNASVLAPARPAARWGGRRGFLALGGMAAGVAWLGLRLGLPQQQPAVLLTTAKGEFRKVPLADHSVANINSASQIEVRLTDRSRDITLLRGEAWFEVAKDKTKPFVVDAGGIRVQAVGTAFGVRRVGKGAEILVTEGVVSVWTDERAGQRSSLAAGEWTYVADQAADITVDRSPDEVARRLAWREG